MKRLATGYRNFAAHEAKGRSPLYAELAAGVAKDAEILAWLDGLPTGKRQPNLLFTAYRLVAGTPSGWEEFRAVLGERRSEVEAVVLERRTQTNEPSRCALHLPLLAALPQPLALLEVLRGAIEVARADPPRLVQGDLTTDLPALIAEAPTDATLVIFHIAVLAYVPSAGRKAFREALQGTWIACEGPDLLDLEPGPPSLFALALDGHRVAWADPHGARLSWG